MDVVGSNALVLLRGGAHEVERLAQRLRELQRPRRGQHAAARVDEQRIVEVAPQAAEGVAHGRLSEAVVRGSGRDVLVQQHRLEYEKQVEIEQHGDVLIT